MSRPTQEATRRQGFSAMNDAQLIANHRKWMKVKRNREYWRKQVADSGWGVWRKQFLSPGKTGLSSAPPSADPLLSTVPVRVTAKPSTQSTRRASRQLLRAAASKQRSRARTAEASSILSGRPRITRVEQAVRKTGFHTKHPLKRQVIERYQRILEHRQRLFSQRVCPLLSRYFPHRC